MGQDTESDFDREQRLAIAYEKGQRDAQVDARLVEHERHLNTINGSIGDLHVEMQNLTKAQQTTLIELATQRTKLSFYAAIGSLIGGGIVTLIFGLVSSAGGGG